MQTNYIMVFLWKMFVQEVLVKCKVKCGDGILIYYCVLTIAVDSI